MKNYFDVDEKYKTSSDFYWFVLWKIVIAAVVLQITPIAF